MQHVHEIQFEDQDVREALIIATGLAMMVAPAAAQVREMIAAPVAEALPSTASTDQQGEPMVPPIQRVRPLEPKLDARLSGTARKGARPIAEAKGSRPAKSGTKPLRAPQPAGTRHSAARHSR